MSAAKKLFSAVLALATVTVISTTYQTDAVAGSVNINSAYVVFTWNDLGMHCLNPTYDKAVILPPYNTLFAQVVRRGASPQIVTSGVTVEYRIINNTYSYGKRDYGQFWLNADKLFGVTPPIDKGLNLVDPSIYNGLTGTMVAKSDHFEADGIPLTPVDDSGVWNPYQVAVVTVKDQNGNVLATTQTTIPTSDEINCAKCHGADAFGDILQKHDALHGTSLAANAPVLCASCHADPILGTTATNGATGTLSAAMHGSHSTRGAACYDCHPGNTTKCSRSNAHTAADGNCETCHGTMAQVATSITSGGRIPWLNEPKCSTCHTGVAEVDTGKYLYRNSAGHGGMYCSACHGSPHAMVPAREASDNYQAMQYQGAAKTIGSCGACHDSSRGEGASEFLGEHGGANPQRQSACNICHTEVDTSNVTLWPHQFQWTATAGAGSGGGTGTGTGTGSGSGTDEGSGTESRINVMLKAKSRAKVGKTVRFRAKVKKGEGNYEYSFWMEGPGVTGSVNVRVYSSDNEWDWVPGVQDVGTNTVMVWARRAGSSNEFDGAMSRTVVVLPPKE